MRKVFVVLGCIGALACGGLGVSIVAGDQSKTSTIQLPEEEGGSAGGFASATPSAKRSVRPDTIQEGTWEVGSDVKPGKYKTKGAVEGIVTLCYWDVQKGGEIVAQGVKDKPGAQGIVTLKTGQTFTTSGCEPWYASK